MPRFFASKGVHGGMADASVDLVSTSNHTSY
jgi:hypothetical protein